MDEHAHWVLLRGLTRDSRHWHDVPQRLAERFRGSRVTCVDLPGNGQRAGETSPASIGGFVAACRETLASQDSKPPYRVLALSLGAMVAIEWARQSPTDIDAIVLINTSLRPWAPPHWRLRPAGVLRLLRTLASNDALVREQAVLALTSSRCAEGTPASNILVAQWAELYRSAPVSRGNVVRQLLAAVRYRCDERPAVRMLLLASTRDALVDVRCSRALARAWRCPLHEHATAGHDLPLDDVTWVLDQVADWMRDESA
jgi:pimeloyl-ACP methyl ester carboxylesterase